jgi:endonuclease/exonuclease/phosphatase family metal-dependent hydrolase
MNYEKKYLKYKAKYNNLKNIMIGGKIDSTGYAIRFTKENYDMLRSENERKKFPFYCDNKNPYLCTLNTPNYGLCKTKITDCSNYMGENNYLKYDLTPERQKNLEYGITYGGYNLYGTTNKDCSKLIENSKASYEGTFNIPTKFKIMTYNLWWTMKITGDSVKDEFHKKFLQVRMNEIARIINNSKSDIVCLQEVGNLSFEIIQPLLAAKYPHYYEAPFHTDPNNNGSRGRSIETVCFSKYQVRGFKLFSVGGNLQYNNSMLIMEFDNVIIFNVYLQAGTRNSPGQKDLWFNYSRCRYNEYLAIGKYLKDNNISKPIVALGDFNTNLNGNVKDWPELKAFQQLKLQDAWLEKYDDKAGFTENTEVNFMRWNVKFEEKIYRIDGIFYTKDKLKTNSIEILGDKPIDIDEDMQKKFYDIRIPNKPNKDQLIRKNGNTIQLWPSDHFAVMAELELI